MPPPIKVHLADHNPLWATKARDESALLSDVIGSNLVEVHHIGSTAIPGIKAKPIIDLMPVVRDMALLDNVQRQIEQMGYRWLGEYGLEGRRYLFRDDPNSGQRLIQAHCYQDGSSEVTRHLAFRDYLVAHPLLAAEYERVKIACQSRHPDNSHEYGDCKSELIAKLEQDALVFYE